ncbi:MAG: RNA polymerase sigma factor [Clostridia bacterium]|nr:RNA polymerase sigma factor [Clostridia bacterium]
MIDTYEKELIKKASKGDDAAFEALAEKYRNLIYRICLIQLKSRENALDVSQNVLIKIWKNISLFRFESSFSTWVYSITRNAVNDFIRREKRRSEFSADEIGNEGDAKTPVSERETPHEAVLKKERSEILRNAIYSLSNEHQDVIILRDIEGYSYSEIASILSENEGTVKSRINRARKALKETLKKRNFFGD